jgi:hypothetical protein
VGLLPVLLVVCGAGLAIYGANTWLGARTEELETPGRVTRGRRPGAVAVKAGLGAAGAGLVLLVLDIVLHTLLALVTLGATVLVVVVVVVVLSRLATVGRRRSR